MSATEAGNGEPASAPALAGIHVLDVTSGMAGPIAAMLLGDNGAEVIKVEPPGGDPRRGRVAGYLVWLRGRRCVTLDLKQTRDRARFDRLVEHADVVLESYSHGAASRLGLAYPRLRELNPRIILCSIRGYPRSHPDADRPGWDLLISARTGLCVGYAPLDYRKLAVTPLWRRNEPVRITVSIVCHTRDNTVVGDAQR